MKRRPSGIYVVRLCVPERLQKAVGRREVHHSTGCRDLRSAKAASAEMLAQWHRSLDELEHMDLSKVIAGSLDLLGEGLLPLDEAAGLLGSDRHRLTQHLLPRKAQFFVRAQGWDGWVVEDIYDLHQEHDEAGQVSVDVSDYALRQLGVRQKVSTELVLRFSDEAAEVVASESGAEICQFLLPKARHSGFIVPYPGVRVDGAQLLVKKRDVEALRLSLAPHAATQLKATPEQSATAESSATHCNPKHKNTRLSVLLGQYIADNRASWRPNTLSTNQDRADILLSLAGDVPLKELDRDLLRELVKKAALLPDSRHLVRSRFKCTSASALQLIDLAKTHSLPTLTPQALKKLIAGFGEILNWGLKQDMLVRNPAAGLADDAFKQVGGKRKADADQRSAFTSVDLGRVFGFSWFAQGTGKRTKRGIFHVYRPHYFWLPLLALYTGGRLNELSQLYLADVVTLESGVSYLDFNLVGEGKLDLDDDDADTSTAGDKSLKNTNASRVVPLHPVLMELGLVKYVEALKAAGHSRLFPELAHDPVKGYGKAAGSWFNERFLGEQLGMVRNGTKTFHSLRHNFATALGDALVPSSIKSQLLGHSRGSSETEKRYDKGRQATQLADYVKALNFDLPTIAPFNVSDGIEAIDHALQLKKSHARRAHRARLTG